MACRWYRCSTPTPEKEEYCTLHKKAMGIEKPKKQSYEIPKMSAKKKEAQPKDIAEKKALTVFYNDLLNHAPRNCEECGNELFSSTIINARTICCHILPKRHFKTVATNLDNIFFGCYACHHGFDNKGKDFILKMKLLPIIKQRVQLLLEHLTPEEKTKVPDYLLNNEK